MGMNIFDLMETGMTYKEAVNFQMKFYIIMLIIVGILYLM